MGKLRVRVTWTTEGNQAWYKDGCVSYMNVYFDGLVTSQDIRRKAVEEFGPFIRSIEVLEDKDEHT